MYIKKEYTFPAFFFFTFYVAAIFIFISELATSWIRIRICPCGSGSEKLLTVLSGMKGDEGSA